MDEACYDLAIIGGGVNGCGIARDAAGRGLSVFLCEKGDLAGATSSASTKLIHGGLRYLEYYEFRLVREALQEREVLWRMAPHIVWPLRFVLPHERGLRPAWMIRAGLFLYDNLGGRKRLPGTRTLDLRRDTAGRPLKARFTRGFEYSDCWVEDARLVVLNAQDAAARGADVRVRTELTGARRENGRWHLAVRDHRSGRDGSARAKVLVNAAGPWVSEVIERVGADADRRVRLVKGSHIVVPRLYAHDKCYIFQNSDGRIVFAIPFERDFTLIGTTDRDYEGDPGAVSIDAEEIAYLCDAASEYFRQPVRPESVVHTYSGVRPLHDDGTREAQAATRDYSLAAEDRAGEAPLLTIHGGKITTYRRLAEAVLERLASYLPGMGDPWTAGAPLPGGDFPADGFDALVAELAQAAPMLGSDQARRLARAYGTRAREIVAGVRTREDWGRSFGHDLTEREVRYLIEQEWARTAEDVLWRRSKLGLRLTPDEILALDSWMAQAATMRQEEAEPRARAS